MNDDALGIGLTTHAAGRTHERDIERVLNVGTRGGKAMAMLTDAAAG